MPAPTVSFIVATYNSSPEYLRTALSSALAQTLSNVEVVISDDSRDDSVADVVASYNDPRIVYQKNSVSLGVVGNHRAAIARAQARYVTILNHDDFINSRFAEVLTNALDLHADATMAFCDHWIVNGKGDRLEQETDDNTRYWKRDMLAAGPHKPFYDLLAAGSIPSAMGAVFRKDALAFSLPDEAGPAYDLWLTLLLCWNGGGAVYIPERLSSWRTHPQSITSQGSAAWSDGEAACWMRVLGEENLQNIHATARQKAALSYYTGALTAWRTGSLPAARQRIQQALSLQPTPKARALSFLCHLPKPLAQALAPHV